MGALSAERRHQRARIINRRLSIVRNQWASGEFHPLNDQPGRLAKFNMDCDCRACKWLFHPRYRDRRGRTNHKAIQEALEH